MKTNITTDNYEAYLLDYMEGSLSPDEAEQLKAFVAAQGLDWDELTEALPHLEAPQIAYEDKESLKKKGAVIPLYVKIASAAAAAGLLLTVTLWPEKSLPKVETVAELRPILPSRIITAGNNAPLPSRTIQFVQAQSIGENRITIQERTEVPLLTGLEPIKPQTLPVSSTPDEHDMELLAYRMKADLNLAQILENELESNSYDERSLSLIGRGLLRLTNGRHDNFASLIGAGVRQAKQDFTEAATDLALTAYQRADDHLAEARERWEEKRSE